MSARFAFLPEAIARAREKYNFTRPLRFSERDVVHETEHENISAGSVLNDGGDEPVRFGEVELHRNPLVLVLLLVLPLRDSELLSNSQGIKTKNPLGRCASG